MKTYLSPIALLVATSLASCSSVPENNQELNQARSDYNAAQANPQVTSFASSELKQAGKALDTANEASAHDSEVGRVSHLAYIASQKTAIAQEVAKQKAAEKSLENAESERNALQLNARTAEVDRANRKVIKAQGETDMAMKNASKAQSENEIAQRQAAIAKNRMSELEIELVALNAKKSERGMVVTLGDILFDTNKSEVKSEGQKDIQKVSDVLRKYPKRDVQIEGYTDNTGSPVYNLALSTRRADAVRTSLVGMGIDGKRITTKGMGESSPVRNNKTAIGRQMNRRVEIVFPEDNSSVSTH